MSAFLFGLSCVRDASRALNPTCWLLFDVVYYSSRSSYHPKFSLFRPPKHGKRRPVYACAMALERNPAAGRAMVEAGWEVASHG